MPIQANGQLSLITVKNYAIGGYGWGNRIGASTYTGPNLNYGESNMGYYRNRWYSKREVPSAQFPATNLSMNLFYGTSPIDEWNCACDYGGGGGGDGGGGGK